MQRLVRQRLTKGPVMLAAALVGPMVWLAWAWGQAQAGPPIPTAMVTPLPSASASAQVLGTATPAPASPSVTPSVTATPRPTVAAKPLVATPRPATPLPATEIATEAVCPGQADMARSAEALVCLTTQARRFHGLGVVSSDPALMAAAGAKAQDMLTCGYGHTACGRAFDYWIGAKGFTGRCSAENVALGQRTPRAVFASWMGSAGHRANILDPDYRLIGIGVAGSASGTNWVMQLGGC